MNAGREIAAARRAKCSRKRRYHAKADADAKIAEMSNGGADTSRLRAYRCLYCDRWHIGTVRRGKVYR